MIVKFRNYLADLLFRSINRIIRPTDYKCAFRGANLEISGNFEFGEGSVVASGANIIVPRSANLLIGKGCYIGRYAELGPGGTIKIGGNTSIQDRSIVLGDVQIGRYCLISLNALISSGRHYFDLKPTWLIKDQDKFVAADVDLAEKHSRKVSIGDDCWIGMNAVIMPGVTIGKGAVIGANSVVTHDVEPYAVVAGAPAKPIRWRLDFKPPTRIHYANEQDWPYFYSGFRISQSDLRMYATHHGVATCDQFEICLDITEKKFIHILAKTAGKNAVQLHFGQVRAMVGPEFHECVFQIPDGAAMPSLFSLSAEESQPMLIVQEVWTS